MISTSKHLMFLFVLLCSLCATQAQEEDGVQEPPAEVTSDSDPYPPEIWAGNPTMSNARVSPNGDYLSWISWDDPTSTGGPVILVFDINTEDGEWELILRQSSTHMQIQGYDWVGPKTFVMSLRQQVRRQTQGFNQGVWASELVLVDVEKKEQKSFGEGSGGLAHVLPDEPTKILTSVQEGAIAAGTKMRGAFRPTAFYKLDLDTGNRELVTRAKLSQFSIAFDRTGTPIRALGYDDKKEEVVYYYRKQGSGDWKEYFRLPDSSFERFSPVGVDPIAEDHIFVIAHNGEDRASFWSYDMANRKFGEKILQTARVDSLAGVLHTNSWKHYNEVTGIQWFSDRRHRMYMDQDEGALNEQLMKIIPNAGNVNVISRSIEGATLIVHNSAPKDPGTYYLIHQGKLEVIGSFAKDIVSDRLAEVRYITYQSTDGLPIAGYVTVPQGEGPFPLVVLPHGGPNVSETVSYDPWGQMLANHGYLVLQPQYRGSHNYGIEFYKASFDGEVSQAGRLMQADKDAGALYLVREGLADPDRMAMVGWSYGGYAALIAASREDQIYQCVVAGAAVADPIMQLNNYRYGLSGAQKEEQLGLWETAVNPMDIVEKVNIPMLLVHGSADQRVSLDHVTKYRRKLDEFDKDYEYIELNNADHFSNTLNYRHRITFYTAMLDFLKDDCGTDGL